MQDFKKLQVWQKAHQLTLDVYRGCRTFRRGEFASLHSQLTRSVASIAANIAEGCGRAGSKDFARFLQISAASASELEYQLLLARDLGLMRQDVHASLEQGVTEVRRMLTALIRIVRARPAASRATETRPRSTED
jgi:four helix bundle protein